jgi:hypothetical protein
VVDMNMRPCTFHRARTLARLRRRQAARVVRKGNVVEVKLGCGCVCEVDFSDPVLAAALHKSIVKKIA